MPSGAGSGRIRLLIPHLGQKIPRLEARGEVDRGRLQVGMARAAVIVGSGTPAGGDCRDAEAVAEALRECLGGASMPASAMIVAILR